jgi:hypothetical protein
MINNKLHLNKLGLWLCLAPITSQKSLVLLLLDVYWQFLQALESRLAVAASLLQLREAAGSPTGRELGGLLRRNYQQE